MRLLAVGALSLLLPVASAIAFPSPAPTTLTTIHHSPAQTPQPTPGARLRAGKTGKSLVRREDVEHTSIFWSTDHPEICGWENSDLDSQIYCGTTETCVYHPGDTAYPGMIGCCSSGASCYFATTCLPASQISASPELTDTPGPFTSYCTNPDWPVCATYIYSDLGVTDFICDAETSLAEVWTSAYETANGTASRYDLYISAVDDIFLSDYVAIFETASASQTPDASVTPDSTPTPESDEDTDSSSSGNSTPIGPIVGGVVGGVAGIAALAVAAIYLLWRRRKNQMAGTIAAGSDNHGGGYQYQSVPETKSPQPKPEFEMPQPIEMESSDPAHRLPEVQGDVPAGKTEQRTSIVAELPADFNHPYRPTPIKK